MRGKAFKWLIYLTFIRITPAYAGKSFKCSEIVFFFKDHPRLCGEKSFEQFRIFCVKGSPPPMRGKVVRLLDNRKCLGITPAYAGKSGVMFYIIFR